MDDNINLTEDEMDDRNNNLLQQELKMERDQHHNNCREDIRAAINEEERRSYARSFGPNWASIISGCGDQ